MRAVLHTLCGCTKEMDIPKRQQFIEVPIFVPAPAFWRERPEDEQITTPAYRTRTFELVDVHHGPYGAAHYREVV